MDVIGMYDAVELVRNFIHYYNESYLHQNAAIEIDILSSYIQEMCRIGLSDVLYWKDTRIDFQLFDQQMEELEKAVEARDYICVYDKVNFELWRMIKNVYEVLWDKNAKVLNSNFWETNKNALKMRYPEVVEQLELIPISECSQRVRPYGLKRKVVYRKIGNMEFDIYSGYNIEGLKIARKIDHEKYGKVYVWGCNGGTVIKEISSMDICGKLKIEVYATDLVELKSILINSRCKGMLLKSEIDWRFNVEEKDLLNSFDMEKRDESYIYICEGKDRLTVLDKFINKYSLNSNVGDLSW